MVSFSILRALSLLCHGLADFSAPTSKLSSRKSQHPITSHLLRTLDFVTREIGVNRQTTVNKNASAAYCCQWRCKMHTLFQIFYTLNVDLLFESSAFTVITEHNYLIHLFCWIM